MRKAIKLFGVLLLFFVHAVYSQSVKVGAERLSQYLPLLKDKRVAIVANQTSMVGKSHLVDTLLAHNIKVMKILSPEHGFRGIADAGEHIKNGVDSKTGIPIVSLYGDHKKPYPGDLQNIDVVVFDIQDVGVRFYTYISTLHYVMEACAENKVSLLLLDRPNPNGFYVDGPMLEEKYKSFVGMDPIPLVHGLTLGEFAQMLNGEKWLSNKVTCALTVIKCENYTHSTLYHLPIKPSPNLKNMCAVYLYPSLGFFEGTVVSVGRGTDNPFCMIGYPKLENAEYAFTPKSMDGAKKPPYEGIDCGGFNLEKFANEDSPKQQGIYLHWLLGLYRSYPDKEKFFSNEKFFDLLAGGKDLRTQIKQNWSESQIKETWKEGLDKYKVMRKKYLLYDDFE